MKKILMTIAMILSATSHAGSVFQCGEMKIDAQMLQHLSEPKCIAYKKNLYSENTQKYFDQAWISGFNPDDSLSIEVYEYDPTTPVEYALEGVTRMAIIGKNSVKPVSTELDVFKNSCGLSLMTAKIIDRETTLLFFDNLTVLKVSPVIMFAQVSLLTSDYDPNAAYLCYGMDPSLSLYDSFISIDSAEKTVQFKNLGSKKSVVVKY